MSTSYAVNEASNDAMELETTNANAIISQAITQEINQLRGATDKLSEMIEENTQRIDKVDKKIEKEKLDREIENMRGEFRVSGYEWTLRDLGRPGTAARRRFVSNLVRVAFVNHELLDQDIADNTPIVDLRPVGWKDKNPLIIKFGDIMVAHGIKERLPKIGAGSTVKIREMRPIILDHMYNDLLRTRRELLNDNPNRTLFIEEKPFPPYLSLMEKTTTDGATTRSPVAFQWSDERFQDPALHHDNYAREIRRKKPSNDKFQMASGSFNRGTPRGRGRGGSRGRGRGTIVTRSSSQNN